ncbi:MAG: SRPBCC family protein [Marmoricola sp.]
MSIGVERTFTTTASPESVFAYLADFTNATAWDPGTVACERVSGDGGVGTRYRNTSRFAGRTVELDYEAVALEPGALVHFEGRNGDSFEGHDRLRLAPSGSGTRVTYDARFDFSGLARLGTPVVRLLLPRIATRTVAQLHRCLDAQL